jgi:hypothetical protein
LKSFDVSYRSTTLGDSFERSNALATPRIALAVMRRQVVANRQHHFEKPFGELDSTSVGAEAREGNGVRNREKKTVAARRARAIEASGRACLSEPFLILLWLKRERNHCYFGSAT